MFLYNYIQHQMRKQLGLCLRFRALVFPASIISAISPDVQPYLNLPRTVQQLILMTSFVDIIIIIIGIAVVLSNKAELYIYSSDSHNSYTHC